MSAAWWIVTVSLLLNVVLVGFLLVCWRAATIRDARGFVEYDDDRR